MEAQATLSNLIPVEKASASFFRDGIYDSRFTASDYNSFTPTNEISQDPIQFMMPPIRSNGVYRLDLAILSLELKIRKASNPAQFLPKASKSAISNNAVNSLWARSAVYLNNVPINQSTQFHNYKAFLSTLIGTTTTEKNSSRECEGYWYESGAEIDTESTSFTERQSMFLDDAEEYKANARICGFLYHDLQTNSAGIPPGIALKIELWRNKDQSAVDSLDAAPDSKIIIESAKLHIPIGNLDMSLFNEYEATLRRSVARIRFRRWVCRTESIPVQTQNYESTILFNPSDFPCRVIVGFQETSRFNGQFKLPFFKFKRVFTHTSVVNEIPNFTHSHEIHHPRSIEQPTHQRGWRSALLNFIRPQTPTEVDLEAQICRPDQNQVRVPRRNLSDVGVTTKVFVEKTQFLINGKPINSLDQMKQTEKQCPESYLTFMKTVGAATQNFSNGISYDDFKDGYGLYAFDLSGSGECYMTNFVPLSRAGHMRFLVDFSGPSNIPLTIVYFMEFSSFVTFNDKGEIEKSFTV